MELKKILADLLKQKKMTVKKLADDTQIPASSIRTWLAGASPRSLDDLKKVAKYFNVSLDYLTFGENDKGPATLEELPLERVFQGWLLVDVKRAVPLIEKDISDKNKK